MRLSEVKDLNSLTYEQMHEIVYGGVKDDGKSADVAFLLGSRPDVCKSRAEGAARLYKAGRVKYIVPSGGVEWDYGGGRISEANYMTEILLSEGVPREAIILENEARTTKENMLFSVVQINRELRLENVSSVIIVTSSNHIRRSMGLAKWLLPRTMEISAYPTDEIYPVSVWTSVPELKAVMKSSVSLKKGLIDHGFIEDIEF